MDHSIISIQRYPEDLNEVLKYLKKDEEMFLYTNLICEFKINQKDLKTSQFHSALDDKKNIILFSKQEGITKNDIIKKFEQYPMCHITFFQDTLELDDSDFILDFMHSAAMLEKAILTTLESGNNDCDFYPYIGGEFIVKLGNNNYTQSFRGLIQMENKILLLMNQKNKSLIKVNDVFKLMQKYNMDCHYYECGEPNLSYFSKQSSFKN